MATAKSTQDPKPANSTNSDTTTEQSTAEAVEQLKEATSQIYEALGQLSGGSADAAKQQLQHGKEQAKELGIKAENQMRERPLATAGVAFAAGWLVSRLMQR